MCGSMLFAGNAGRCTPSNPVLRMKHMLGMHKRVVCVQMCGQLTSNMGSGSVSECLTALAGAVQHDEASCKRFKAAWNSTSKMPLMGSVLPACSTTMSRAQPATCTLSSMPSAQQTGLLQSDA